MAIVLRVALVPMVELVVPFPGVRLVVVLHQNTEEDDEDDLKDEADDRQLQPHVGLCARHVFLPVEQRRGLLRLDLEGQKGNK